MSISTTVRILLLCLVLPLFPLTSVDLYGQDNLSHDPEARRVFEELDRRRDKITYETSAMSMQIVDPRGRVREREMRFFNHNTDQLSESLVIFASPSDVRGTALLTIERNSNELQKLYLPALGRVQTISSSQKGDRFMGSDFTYEDLGAQSPDDYTFSMVAETDTATVLKAVKEGDSQYAYMYFFVHPERYTLTEAHYFNNQDTRIKRLVASDYEQVMDEVWRAGQMIMYDEHEDRYTKLEWSNRKVNETIPAWRFTERGLRRGL
jgi:hypothetical protein